MRKRRYRRSPRPKGGGFADQAKGLMLLLVLGGVVGGVAALKTVFARHATDASSCYINASTPARAAILVDVTDRMAVEQNRLVTAAANQVLSELPVAGLLMVGPITGQVPNQMSPLVETCRPSNDNNTDRNRFRDHFDRPLRAALAELASASSASASPILETILATANDPALATNNGVITLVVISDFMQNSPVANFYSNPPHLPRPIGHPLRNVRVRMLVFRNADYAALQPAATDAFAAWLDEAGATVEYEPPAWMAVSARPSVMELANAH